MIRGLLEKTVREVWLGTILFGFALCAAMGMLTFVLPKAQEGMGEMFAKMPFMKNLIGALVGTEISGEITARLMQSILWVHPVVLALLWAHDITFCTRIPAAEIDRGTIDLLLGLPVSRRGVYGAETIVWILSGAFILLVGACGHWLTVPAIPVELRPPPRIALYVLVNLFAVYLAVGGLAFLISSLSDRRGIAIGTIFGLVLTSFLLNFLAPFWPLAKQASVTSVMHYYQPAEILRSETFPWWNVTVLCSCATISWLAGGIVFLRRDVCTV